MIFSIIIIIIIIMMEKLDWLSNGIMKNPAFFFSLAHIATPLFYITVCGTSSQFYRFTSFALFYSLCVSYKLSCVRLYCLGSFVIALLRTPNFSNRYITIDGNGKVSVYNFDFFNNTRGWINKSVNF